MRRKRAAACAVLGLLAALAAADRAAGVEVEPESVPWFVSLGGCGGGDVAAAQILGHGRRLAPGTGHGEAQAFGVTLRAATLRTIGDAACARYRDFIAHRSPTRAPSRTGGVARIPGAARAGRTLACRASGYTPQHGARIDYAWPIVASGRGGHGRPRSVGRGRTHRVTLAERNHRLACIVSACDAGGFVTVGAANRFVAR